ncbi:hypothetical protein BaRGS_00010553 [Batillaria attramentaria]|uniref:Uncharacterized protein n=1 Tax=Batillaria attramentaria TaxID=370345 RepID=A0ABD0LFW1_9CAEN
MSRSVKDVSSGYKTLQSTKYHRDATLADIMRPLRAGAAVFRSKSYILESKRPKDLEERPELLRAFTEHRRVDNYIIRSVFHDKRASGLVRICPYAVHYQTLLRLHRGSIFAPSKPSSISVPTSVDAAVPRVLIGLRSENNRDGTTQAIFVPCTVIRLTVTIMLT